MKNAMITISMLSIITLVAQLNAGAPKAVPKAVPKDTSQTHHVHSNHRYHDMYGHRDDTYRYRDAGIFAPVVFTTDAASDIAHGIGDAFAPRRVERAYPVQHEE